MSNKNPSPPTRWKKGIPSPNPGGRPKKSDFEKELFRLTVETYGNIIKTALTGTVSDLQVIIKDPASTVIQVGVATALLKAMEKGDPMVLENFASRIIGKMPEVIELSSTSIDVEAKLTDKQVEAVVKKLMADV